MSPHQAVNAKPGGVTQQRLRCDRPKAAIAAPTALHDNGRQCCKTREAAEVSPQLRKTARVARTERYAVASAVHQGKDESTVTLRQLTAMLHAEQQRAWQERQVM
eukprot:6707095-Alexandrium_andersonii.AAC.1